MSRLRMIYLGLAVAGAVLPLLSNWQALVQTDWTAFWPPGDWRALADRYYLVLHWEQVVAALALTVWSFAEVLVRRNWSALWAIPATWIIGLGCGLPLYLYLRTRPVV